MPRLLLSLIFISGGLWIASGVSAAQVEFPDNLFGVTHGGIYDIGTCDRDTGELPVKRCRGIRSFLGQGNYYYFEPEAAHEGFEYIERKGNEEGDFYETSFRLFLLPVISANKNTDDGRSTRNKYEVAVIEWRDNVGNINEAYNWAINLCDDMKPEIGITPDISNNFEGRIYSCDYVHDESKLEIDASRGVKSYALKYTDEIYNEKLDALDSQQFEWLK